MSITSVICARWHLSSSLQRKPMTRFINTATPRAQRQPGDVAVDFVGPSYELSRKKADTQRLINMATTPIESGNSGKAAVFLQSIAGLKQFSDYVAPVIPPGFPCFPEVLIQLQTGTYVDQSSFAHALTSLSGVTPLIDKPNFPSGKGIQIAVPAYAGGLQMGNYDAGSPLQTEWNFGSSPVCFETFINTTLPNGNQILFNNGFGFNGTLWVIDGDGVMALRMTPNHVVTASASVSPFTPRIVAGEDTYVCIQLHGDGHASAWVGAVTGGVAYGGSIPFDPMDPVPAVVDPTTYGPYIGYVGAYGGDQSFVFDGMRITKCNLYPQSDALSRPIPDGLYPTSA